MEFLTFLAADFRHGSGRRKVALEDDKVAVFFDRILDRTHDRLALRVRFEWREVLFERFARDREAIPVKQAFGKEGLHHRNDAADIDEFAHQKTTTGF